MNKFGPKIFAGIIVTALLVVSLAPISINLQHKKDTNVIEVAEASAFWDALIRNIYEGGWVRGARPTVNDLSKFIKLQVTIRLIKFAIEKTELGGIVRNYREYIFDELSDVALDTIDEYFDDYMPDNVSGKVKRDAKNYVNNQIKKLEDSVDSEIDSAKTNKTASNSSLTATKVDYSTASFGEKAIAWVKTLFKAQFVGTRALAPDNPMMAFAATTVPSQWSDDFADLNTMVQGYISCNDEVCNDTMAALTAIEAGLKEYEQSQKTETVRTLINEGYTGMRDEEGNELQWPGLAQTTLEGNVEEFAAIITNSEDYTPGVAAAMIGSFIIDYVFNKYID